MKKTQSGFALIEGLLIILILAVIGFGGYYVWNSQKQADKNNAEAVKVSQSAPTIAKNEASSDKEMIASVIAYKCHQMSSSITAAKVKTVLLNNYNSSDSSLRISGNYASAPGTCAEAIGQAAGGFADLLKKNDGQWNIVFQGQSEPDCSSFDNQGWPSEIVNQCYDSVTQTDRAPK